MLQTVAIAALYTIITVIQEKTVGFTKDAIQSRLAEALTILPVFTPAAIPGLFLGCLAADYIVLIYFQTAPVPLEPFYWDMICGSLSTMLAAIVTYSIRKKIKKQKYVAAIPPIVINMIVLPLLFTFKYRLDESFWYYVASIGVGELLACGIFGTALLLVLDDYKERLFPSFSLDDSTKEDKTEDITEATGDMEDDV